MSILNKLDDFERKNPKLRLFLLTLVLLVNVYVVAWLADNNILGLKLFVNELISSGSYVKAVTGFLILLPFAIYLTFGILYFALSILGCMTTRELRELLGELVKITK